ncbi:hypothetical protein [Streptomyces globosus]|nr:hypothetical protein [Streptomyces globosus]
MTWRHVVQWAASTATSTREAVGRMPYDFSQARVRYEERVLERLYPV